MLRSRCRGRSTHPSGHWIWQSSKDRMAFDQAQLHDRVWSQKNSPEPRRIYLSLKLLSHFQTTNFHSVLSRNSPLQPVFQPSWIPVMSASHVLLPFAFCFLLLDIHTPSHSCPSHPAPVQTLKPLDFEFLSVESSHNFF